VSGLHIAYVEVVIGEDRTPNRADEDRSILNAEFVNRAGQHFMDHTVARIRAEVGLVL